MKNENVRSSLWIWKRVSMKHWRPSRSCFSSPGSFTSFMKPSSFHKNLNVKLFFVRTISKRKNESTIQNVSNSWLANVIFDYVKTFNKMKTYFWLKLWANSKDNCNASSNSQIASGGMALYKQNDFLFFNKFEIGNAKSKTNDDTFQVFAWIWWKCKCTGSEFPCSLEQGRSSTTAPRTGWW